MTLFEGGRAVFGMKTTIRRLMPGNQQTVFLRGKLPFVNSEEKITNCFPRGTTAICRFLEYLTDKLSFLGERLPFTDSADDHLSICWENLGWGTPKVNKLSL